MYCTPKVNLQSAFRSFLYKRLKHILNTGFNFARCLFKYTTVFFPSPVGFCALNSCVFIYISIFYAFSQIQIQIQKTKTKRKRFPLVFQRTFDCLNRGPLDWYHCLIGFGLDEEEENLLNKLIGILLLTQAPSGADSD